MIKTSMPRRAVAATLAIALAAAAAVPAGAAPVLSSTASMASALPRDVVDVRWRHYRGGYGGGAIIGGVAAGLALGAIAGAAARPYYYGPGYDYPAYAEPYGAYEYYPAPPAYVAPRVYAAPPVAAGGPMRQCWISNDDRGYGYWRPC
jgi:hypothetical protein